MKYLKQQSSLEKAPLAPDGDIDVLATSKESSSGILENISADLKAQPSIYISLETQVCTYLQN
jgi:hypothetical protein